MERGKESLEWKLDFLCLQSEYLCPWRVGWRSIVLWKICNSRCRIRVHIVADSIGRDRLMDLEIEAEASLAITSTSVLPIRPT